ncbi:putative protein N(5)-glutamine methyltransferase [Herbiconiux sp. L3-i23]|uniref:putative protein N(5)-glutamine methyltransferase n=1 Tax=Herbiconiux sp. L3-i23 TaxID=2905871 RepID=UPI0020580E33|nr:putative protein N(5)-glutamine methyltransferase [Herbiconiux sp. L3-i23]BDI22865.1 methylase [Herbiconiux sp. L3-i23]
MSETAPQADSASHPDAHPLFARIVERLRAAGCVFAEEEAQLLIAEAADAAQLEAMTRRRIEGEPLEQIVGWVEFAGLRLAVAPRVFVPRRRSEILVDSAAPLLAAGDELVELCCGVAAVSAALERRVPGIGVSAADIDPAVLIPARRNLGPEAAVFQGDLFAPLPPRLRGTVRLVVANAPYVPSGEIGMMPLEAREHEPGVALDGGVDGLGLHRRIAAEAPEWLRPGGHLLIETSRRQAAATLAVFTASGFDAQVVSDDEIDGTAVLGRLR